MTKKNAMVKNKAMRACSVMLVLALITTCAISATFAKYVTSADGSDSARVAYWGFSGSTSQDLDLFKTTYAADDTSDASITNSVVSATSDNLVAPGTKGSTTLSFKYTGYENTQTQETTTVQAPEVAYKFTTGVEVMGIDETSASTNVDVDSLDANPNFKWTLTTGKTATADGTTAEYQTLKALCTAIAGLSGATNVTDTYDTDGKISSSKNYTAGSLPAFLGSAGTYSQIVVGWEWTFYTSDAVDTGDTNMGNALTYAGAETDNGLDDLKLKVTVGATQID